MLQRFAIEERGELMIETNSRFKANNVRSLTHVYLPSILNLSDYVDPLQVLNRPEWADGDIQRNVSRSQRSAFYNVKHTWEVLNLPEGYIPIFPEDDLLDIVKDDLTNGGGE